MATLGSAPSNTELDVSRGGTGAATAGGARNSLGVAIGTDVQAYSAVLASLAGLANFAVGDLLYASGNTALAKLPAVALGQVVVSTGVGVAPAWSATPALSGITLRGSDVDSQINNRATAGAVFFDNSVANTRIYHTIQNIGTDAFTLHARFVVPLANPIANVGIVGLGSSTTTLAVARAITLRLKTNGALDVILFGATESDYRIASVDGFVTTYAGKVVDVHITRTATTLILYINGVATAFTETTGGTPPAWTDTVTSTYMVIGTYSTTAASIYNERILRAIAFNRALSAAEVAQFRERGVAWNDMWGRITDVIGHAGPTLNGGFETAGTNGGTKTNVSSVSRARSTNVATIVATEHGLATGNVVTVASMGGTGYNGTGLAVTVSDADTFTYACVGDDEETTPDTAGRVRTDVFANWAEGISGASIVARETAAPFEGSSALRLDVDAANSAVNVQQSVLVPGKRYRLTATCKVSSTAEVPIIGYYDGAYHVVFCVPTTEYAQYSVEFTARGTDLQVNRYSYSGAASKSLFVDNVVLTRIGCVCDSDLENYDQLQGTYVHDRSTNKFPGVATATGLTQTKAMNRSRALSVRAAGTAYQLTATPALLDFGTTDPSLVITLPGTWLITARVRLDYNAATFAAPQTVTLKLRRTNNTAADLPNADAQVVTGAVTTATQTFMVVPLRPAEYSTKNTDDIIQIFGDVDVLPSAGSLDAVQADISAVRLF